MDWRHHSMDILGLNETEIRILEVLNNAKRIQDIADETEISRTGINYAIKQLIHKGLVFKIKHGKRNLFVGAVPSQVAHQLQRIIDDISIDSKDKRGARIKTSKQSEFIIHAGLKEVISVYERATSMSKDIRIRAIQPNKS